MEYVVAWDYEWRKPGCEPGLVRFPEHARTEAEMFADIKEIEGATVSFGIDEYGTFRVLPKEES